MATFTCVKLNPKQRRVFDVCCQKQSQRAVEIGEGLHCSDIARAVYGHGRANAATTLLLTQLVDLGALCAMRQSYRVTYAVMPGAEDVYGK